jgi:hypothetical protein
MLKRLGCSGSVQDRRRLLEAAVKNYENDPFDVIVGDWMSEANMTFNSAKHYKGETRMLCVLFLQIPDYLLDMIM